MKDYYQILGLSRDTSDAEIKRAFRKLAHKYHPDTKGGGDEAKFKEVNEAYQVLSDSEKKAKYDQFGTTFEQGGYQPWGWEDFSQAYGSRQARVDFSDFLRGFSAQGGPAAGWGGFEDIFSEIFGTRPRRARYGPTPGEDININIDIPFEEAVFGTKREIEFYKRVRCPKCNGKGYESGTKIINCSTCGGSGQITSTKQSMLGSFTQITVCPSCKGEGKRSEKPCPQCGGDGRVKEYKKVRITIPAGIDSGQTIRILGQGEAGLKGGPFGDLYIQVRVGPHKYFKREGYNLKVNLPISFTQAALGDKVEIETLDGKRVQLDLLPGTQSGKVFKIKGKGVPHLQGSGKGDLLVKIKVVTPERLLRGERQLFQELSEIKGQSAQIRKGLLGKILR